jgi:hypothetical protein
MGMDINAARQRARESLAAPDGTLIDRSNALGCEHIALDVIELVATVEHLTEALRIQAASNKALVVECDKYRELLLQPMDLRIKRALTGETP